MVGGFQKIRMIWSSIVDGSSIRSSIQVKPRLYDLELEFDRCRLGLFKRVGWDAPVDETFIEIDRFILEASRQARR